MAGIIVTGHGHFPTGILSAIELVAGKPENVEGVDFESGQSSDDLMRAMNEAVLKLEGDDILILADLVGGTPFNMAVRLQAEMTDKNLKVMAGTNMPALVEAVFSRGFVSFEDLLPMIKRAGVDGIVDLEDIKGDIEETEFVDGL